MADRITITPDELRSSSQTFNSKADEITDILEQLRSEVDSLESTWDGAAQDSFFQSYEEMNQTLVQFPEILQGIAQQLTAVADTLEQTDEELASALGN